MATTQPLKQTLPNDLILEILSWLPVKSLMRFRCVSKTWNSLVFHPPFIKLHLQRSPKNTHILLTFHEPVDRESDEKLFSGFAAQCSIPDLFENPSSTVDDSFHRFNRHDFVFGVCNGLVSLVNYIGDDEYEEYVVQFWNPATRVESEDSPCLHIDSCDYRLGEYYLKWGFGYDDLCDTYKVVVILYDVQSQKRVVIVHCMGDNCWRKILTCPAFPILAQVNGQLVGESLNWLALRRSSSDYQWETVTANELVIFSYDLKKETCRFLSMPDDLCEVPCIEPELGVLKGCLVCIFHHHKDTHFVVWLMREFADEKSWTQLLNVSYEHLQTDGCCHCPVLPLCKSEDDDDILLLANNEDDKFVFYNQRDNTIDRTEDFSKDTHAFWSHDYIQSLVLPY